MDEPGTLFYTGRQELEQTGPCPREPFKTLPLVKEETM